MKKTSPSDINHIVAAGSLAEIVKTLIDISGSEAQLARDLEIDRRCVRALIGKDSGSLSPSANTLSAISRHLFQLGVKKSPQELWSLHHSGETLQVITSRKQLIRLCNRLPDSCLSAAIAIISSMSDCRQGCIGSKEALENIFRKDAVSENLAAMILDSLVSQPGASLREQIENLLIDSNKKIELNQAESSAVIDDVIYLVTRRRLKPDGVPLIALASLSYALKKDDGESYNGNLGLLAMHCGLIN